MLRKVVLIGLLVFVGLPTAWVGVEHLRGRSMLSAALARIEFRHETLDLASMLPPAVPFDSNGLPALIAASHRMGDLAGIMPPGFEMIGPARAIPGTRMEVWTARTGTNGWDGLTQALQAHSGDLQDLHAALAKPARRSDLDLSAGFARMKIPHLSPIKNAVVALAASSTEAGHRGDMEGAVADLLGMRVLEGDLADEPILISQLVRVACGSIANARVWSVFHARDWNESELASLQKTLTGGSYTAPMVRSLEGERAGGLYEIQHATSEDLVEMMRGDALARAFGGGPAPLQMPDSVDGAVEFAEAFVQQLGRGVLRCVLLPVWRFGWGDQSAAFSLDCLGSMIDVYRRADRLRSFAETKSLDVEALVEARTAYGLLRTVFARVTLPVLEGAVVKGFRVENERAMHETAIALRRFQIRNKRLPSKLEELVPELLASVPIDRMDGKPLRYRRDTEETFTLWSVGDDLKDDGGDPSPPADRNSPLRAQWWMAKDAVWPHPAAAAEIEEWQRSQVVKMSGRNPGKPGGGGSGRAVQMTAELMKRYGLNPAVLGMATNAAATNAAVGK